MEKTENPLVKELHEAHRKDDRAEVERLEAALRDQLQDKTESIKTILDTKKEQYEVLKEESSRKAAGERRKIYKELIGLYREARELMNEISTVKKIMREGAENGETDDDNEEAAK
jgi:hypothetical protein